MKEAACQSVTLGPRILRAETAAVASVTMAMTLWGDL
jgi:16S rRNA U1498 N3-methylase RsmE